MGEVKFKQEYLCTFESNIEFLTISEIEDRYRVKIDTSQIGFDTGVCFNTIALKNFIFDPYPFILMNLFLSCIAALQAPIIMMSQNRQEEKDRKRSENDYLINLKAELELRSLHQKVDLLLEEQIQMLIKSQAEQMEILKKLQKHSIPK